MTRIPLLVVDDNPLNLKLLRILLSSKDYDIRTSTSAEEAQEILQSFTPRLILLDIQLPGMDGLEFTRSLKLSQATRDIIILAVTAYAMKGDEEKVLAAGCNGYISKPIDTRALPAVVAKFLGNAPIS